MFGKTEKCTICNKSVYATEKLNILGKTWHKWCFKCTVCGMSLTMKNYQATGGDPYCRAHYPAAGASEDRQKTSDASAATAANYQAGVAPTVQIDMSQIRGRDEDSGSSGSYSSGSVAPSQSYAPPAQKSSYAPAAKAAPPKAAPPAAAPAPTPAPAPVAAAPAAAAPAEEYYEEGEYYEGEYYEEGGEYYEEGYYEEGEYYEEGGEYYEEGGEYYG